jgi:hypothetical protein
MRWIRGMGVTLSVAVMLLGIGLEGDAASLKVGEPAPEITGERWINSEPLSMTKLRGRVVFVEFWTFG